MIDRLKKRQRKIRKKIIGTDSMPRMSVYKSNKNIEVQLIDDSKQSTILGLSTVGNSELAKITSRKERYSHLGKQVATQAIKNKISRVAFDRRGRKYHGLIKAVAAGAREGGLKF